MDYTEKQVVNPGESIVLIRCCDCKEVSRFNLFQILEGRHKQWGWHKAKPTGWACPKCSTS